MTLSSGQLPNEALSSEGGVVASIVTLSKVSQLPSELLKDVKELGRITFLTLYELYTVKYKRLFAKLHPLKSKLSCIEHNWKFSSSIIVPLNASHTILPPFSLLEFLNA